MESLATLQNNIIEEECELSTIDLAAAGSQTHTAVSRQHVINNLRRRRHLSPVSIRSKYVAEVDEVRINPIVSKKGFLNFLEEKSIGWMKRFVAIRRPYVFIYAGEKDPVELSVFNLSNAQIVYNAEQIEMLQVY